MEGRFTVIATGESKQNTSGRNRSGAFPCYAPWHQPDAFSHTFHDLGPCRTSSLRTWATTASCESRSGVAWRAWLVLGQVRLNVGNRQYDGDDGQRSHSPWSVSLTKLVSFHSTTWKGDWRFAVRRPPPGYGPSFAGRPCAPRCSRPGPGDSGTRSSWFG